MSDIEENMEVSSGESDDDIDSTLNEEDNSITKKEVYLPGKPLEEGEELVCDETAYIMLHQAQTGAPCLSFDIIEDKLGQNRETYPLTAYIVGGTQSQRNHPNNVIVMKLHNLHKTIKHNDENELSDEEDEVQQPNMVPASIKHIGGVNRIRSHVYKDTVLVSTWSELGRVHIFNINEQMQAVDNSQLLTEYNKQNKSNTIKPLYTFSGHRKEGFAMDWCNLMPGVLATGDCQRDIHIWKPAESKNWIVDQRPLIGHTDSVEDLQWSPSERHVLASCSVDRTIRIWDTRAPPNQACMLFVNEAHSNDINVISWNKNEPFIVSGGDDAVLNVWDLRKFKEKIPIATFKHHSGPITTVEWHPTDSAVFASGGADNQIVIWDLSVEKDNEKSNEIDGLPPQLLFIHQGQDNIKELHWHRQLPGVIISTAESGLNIFRTISV